MIPWLRFRVAEVVVQAGSYGSNLTPSVRTSICRRCSPKKRKKKKNPMVYSTSPLECQTGISNLPCPKPNSRYSPQKSLLPWFLPSHLMAVPSFICSGQKPWSHPWFLPFSHIPHPIHLQIPTAIPFKCITNLTIFLS